MDTANESTYYAPPPRKSLLRTTTNCYYRKPPDPGACRSGGNRRQRGQESELCLPFLGWMTQQLSYSPWGRVGDQDSQIALPLAVVWI